MEHGQKIGRLPFVGRKVSRFLTNLALPTKIKAESDPGEEDPIKKAKKLLNDGTGLIIVYTHPSRTDTNRLMGLWKEREFAERRCLIPIARHQFILPARLSAMLSNLEFYPIVTQETINKNKNGDLALNHGSRGFLKSAREALAQAGVILVAPSMTRSPHLLLPDIFQPTDILLNAAREDHTQVAVMTTGFEIQGATSYDSAGGYNFFRGYTLHVGKTWEGDEILEELERFRGERNLSENPKRPFTYTDQWLYETQFPKVVPPYYLP